jgi:hypothetical protein
MVAIIAINYEEQAEVTLRKSAVRIAPVAPVTRVRAQKTQVRVQKKVQVRQKCLVEVEVAQRVNTAVQRGILLMDRCREQALMVASSAPHRHQAYQMNLE